MANQVALRLLTRPGDHVIVARESHAVWHETGGSAANAGVQFSEIGDSGTFSVAEFLAACHPAGHALYPPTSLVEIENTHNRSGGVIFSERVAREVCAAASDRGIATYLDGARLWNAAVALGQRVETLSAPFDLVAVALSKGLGAPGGSLLTGPRARMIEAVRHRRMLGGAMRQIGSFAAAGLYALDHHVGRLADDHANIRQFAERLTSHPFVRLDLSTVQTNIVVFDLEPGAPDAATVVDRARDRGVLVLAFGPRTIRAVAHLDVGRRECLEAADVLADAIGE
jgi:threonine aldolase